MFAAVARSGSRTGGNKESDRHLRTAGPQFPRQLKGQQSAHAVTEDGKLRGRQRLESVREQRSETWHLGDYAFPHSFLAAWELHRNCLTYIGELFRPFPID